MDLEKMTAKLREANAFIPGKRLMIDYGPAGVLFVDGIAGAVSNEDGGAADTIISISWDDWLSLASGTLDPMTAYMKGKLRIEGDMGLAMQLQGLFSGLRG